MSTIFIIQENNRFNYGPAEAFGDIKFLTALEYSPIKGSLQNATVLADVKYGLEAFKPDDDYLLLSGNPVMIGYAMHLCLSKPEGYVKVLQWDRHYNEYKEIHFKP